MAPMPSFGGALATMKFTQTLVKRCIAILHSRLLDHKNTEELSIRLIDEKVINRKLLRGRGMDISRTFKYKCNRGLYLGSERPFFKSTHYQCPLTYVQTARVFLDIHPFIYRKLLIGQFWQNVLGTWSK